ncbi:MAG TPA: extracellular solute-binding protein [Steroidobacteraceae bacterium]|jgi:putrescine transport system substrate-binding protein|nr:extracellular solute-binding protein [Steroidobacteraceae bacterium]
MRARPLTLWVSSGLFGFLTLLLGGCTPSSAPSRSTAGERVLNVYNWYDYIKPELLKLFQTQTGIVVHYDVFDSNLTLAARLLAGHSGYDVVFPSASYLQMLSRAGAIRSLDKSALPNLANMDPVIMRDLARHDPGNAHAVVYAWGITGFAYDEAQIHARLAQAPLDSWAMLFDPKVAAHFADCGIGLYESPAVIVPSVLAWLGERPDSEDPKVLARAAAALMAVRPYIRKIGTDSLVAQLAEGDLCLIIASNGDALQARERVRTAGSKHSIGYSIPREGAVMWIDTAAIVADAPHPDNAARFINFLMDAKVAADNANAIHFPNGNAASQPLVQAQLANAAIYPHGAQAARLIPERLGSDAFVRLRTRMWTRFRTGQ